MQSMNTSNVRLYENIVQQLRIEGGHIGGGALECDSPELKSPPRPFLLPVHRRPDMHLKMINQSSME
jgi:hypothetical protein